MNKKVKLTKEDIPLLLLFVDDFSKILCRVRLQSMVFIFQEEIYGKYRFSNNLEDSFEFIPSNYGPFSVKVIETILNKVNYVR